MNKSLIIIKRLLKIFFKYQIIIRIIKIKS